MHFAYVIAFFLPVVALEASDEKKCCYPEKLSGETFFNGAKLNDFYIDYERHLIVEDWHGRLRTNYVVFDLNASKRYRIKTDGSCRKYPLSSAGNYAQCMPETATKLEDHDEEVSYSYELQDTDIVKTLKKLEHGACLPVEISKTKGTRRVVMKYEAHQGIDKDDIFDINLDDCV